MKRLLFIVLALYLGQAGAQQSGQSVSLDAKTGHVKPKAEIATRQMLQNVSTAKDDEPIDMMALVATDFDEQQLAKHGIIVGTRAGDVVTLRLSARQTAVLDDCDAVIYYQVAHEVAPECNNTRFDTRTDSVQEGTQLPQAYDGEGVIIGITDWGFDYKHPNYNGAIGNRRILRVWDQFRMAGPAPDGYTYGTELTDYNSIKAAQCDTFNLYSYGTHGTHVTGIAAGAGIGNTRYRGQAPGASLLLSSFLLNESAWIDAVGWMKRVAEEEGKRLVINSSWGMYTFSTLDGTSLLSRAIDSYSDAGIVFVTSAGNNGDCQFHISKDFSVTPGDTLRTIAAYNSAVGQDIVIWGAEGSDFAAALAIENGDTMVTSPFFSTDSDGYSCDTTLVCGTDSISVSLLWESDNPLNHKSHMNITFSKNESCKVHLFITAAEGAVHAWNVGRKDNHAGNNGAAFRSFNLQGYTNGDNNYGVSEPGCAAKTITVAAHTANRINTVTNELMLGDIAYFSSHGPIINGTPKPELSAPGVNVISSMSSFTTETGYTVVANSISGGRSYPYTEMSGTSMSSPAVTGIVALMLQANPDLSVNQVREILFSTTRNDSKTGAIHATGEPSNIWGWGKADALNAVRKATETIGIETPAVSGSKSCSIYPNPASQYIVLQTGLDMHTDVTIYSSDGRLVWRGDVYGTQQIDTHKWHSGLYIATVRGQQDNIILKFIKK